MRHHPKQHLALDFILQEVRSGAGFPRPGQIAFHLGHALSTARDLLARLTINGYLRRRRAPHPNKLGYRLVYEVVDEHPEVASRNAGAGQIGRQRPCPYHVHFRHPRICRFCRADNRVDAPPLAWTEHFSTEGVE